MSYYTNKDFFTLFDNGLSLNDLNCRKLSILLSDEGYQISARSMQRWHNMTAVPGPENAKIVLTYLYQNMLPQVASLPTDNEIRQSIIRAKSIKLPERSNETALIQTIRINYFALYRKKMKPGEIQYLLQKRINETVGDSPGKYSRYVTALIRKDLNQKILPDLNEKVKTRKSEGGKK